MRSRKISKETANPQAPRALAVLTLVLGAGVLGGCQDVLFPANTPRTQFEAYDRMRNQVAPERELDTLGREQAALRARLSPR